MARPSRAAVRNEQRISRIYRARCSNIQIPMMKIPDIFKIGQAAINAGDDDKTLGDKIAAFVETIRA